MNEHARPELGVNAVEADITYRRVMWRLMPFLVTCYVVAYIDRSNVGFAKLQFTRDLAFSEAVYGLGSGLFYLGYLSLEIPSNLMLARVGIRLTLLRIMIPWGLCSAAMAFMRSPVHFYGLRLLLGAAEAGFFPGILLYLSYWIPPKRRARFTSLFMASIALSGVIGGPVSGWIMHACAGTLGLRGWQWLFLIEGLPAVVIGVAAYFVLDDTPRTSRWLSDAEKTLILRELEAEHGTRRARDGGSLRDVARDPRLYRLMVMAVALLVGTSGIFLWLPTIVNRAGITNVFNVGMFSTIPFLVGIVAQAAVARHSDRTGERSLHAAACALVAAIGWAALPSVAGSIALTMTMLTLVVSGTLATMGPFWALPPAILPPGVAAPGIALITTVASLASFVSPIVVGRLTDATGTLAAGQYYFAAMLTIGAVALVTYARKRTEIPISKRLRVPALECPETDRGLEGPGHH